MWALIIAAFVIVTFAAMIGNSIERTNRMQREQAMWTDLRVKIQRIINSNDAACSVQHDFSQFFRET